MANNFTDECTTLVSVDCQLQVGFASTTSLRKKRGPKILTNRGVRGIFFRGGTQSHFPDFFPGVKCFFPVENSHFGGPKTNFSS